MHRQFFSRFVVALLFLLAAVAPSCAQAPAKDAKAPLFFEAENFKIEGSGWRPVRTGETRQASLGVALNGALGDVNSTASQTVKIPRDGAWRVWVRFVSLSPWRGPFTVDVLSGDKVVATKTFDQEYVPGTPDWNYRWESLETNLKAGDYTVRFSKFENKESVGYTRAIDAILLTDDAKLEPDHRPFGPQTWMKVTLGDGYEKPLQVHIFADHYRDPWYQHFALTKGTFEEAIEPSRPENKLTNGETTGWLNISETIYQDSGARLVVYPAYTYWERAPRFKGTIEFATRASDDAVVKKFEVDQAPSTIQIIVPPNLNTKENIAELKADREFSAEYGKIADAYDWPKFGKPPKKFPFLVTALINPAEMSAEVLARELKTLSYFGYNNSSFHHIGGAGWHTKGTFSAPDLERLRATAGILYQQQSAGGLKADEIIYAMATDEPGGEPASTLAADAASIEGFRAWLRGKKLTPADLLVKSWDEVKPVVETEREKFPALHYFTQHYRTVALGNMIATEKKILHENWKSDFPVNVNFSDGAIYFGNFYGQGVDYFTLLRETDQNAIWGEDWSNLAATYQDAAFNVDLMRAAARKGKQNIGHYLIAYAGRKGYDVRLKAASEAARGVKIFNSFVYGPVWGTHEGSVLQKYPQVWGDNAAAVREIGAVEDLLFPAQPRPAQVALLYSSASDIWQLNNNLASGFDRMHTWLALAHAQIPVDVVPENEVAEGQLAKYKVCYLSDPNLTRAAATKLAAWVKSGGTLILAAGAAQRDEFNRPLTTLDALLPFKRRAAETVQAFNSPGSSLPVLNPIDTVKEGAAKIDVLSIRQKFDGVPNTGATIQATFSDGSPASIRSVVGKGAVVARGYFPALDYMRKALVARGGLATRDAQVKANNGVPAPEDVLALNSAGKSDNPWEYPADARDALLSPVRDARVTPPIVCSVPLVDAIYMTAPGGVVIPLANYTLQPIKEMTLEIALDKPAREVRSVHAGVLKFEKLGARKIRVRLPLDCTDYLTIR